MPRAAYQSRSAPPLAQEGGDYRQVGHDLGIRARVGLAVVAPSVEDGAGVFHHGGDRRAALAFGHHLRGHAVDPPARPGAVDQRVGRAARGRHRAHHQIAVRVVGVGDVRPAAIRRVRQPPRVIVGIGDRLLGRGGNGPRDQQ